MYEPGGASRKDRVFNLLSIFILLLVALIGIVFLIVFSDPSTALNPFPPPTQIPPIVLPTATATPRSLPPTWTATIDMSTATLTPTIQTSEPGEAVTIEVNATGTLEATVAGGYPFQLQGEPTGMASTIFKPDSGCSWLGVAGNVYDLQGRPVQGLVVRLGGAYQGKYIKEQFTLTGLARSYGESGFEFTIANVPEESYHTLWIQLYDQADIPFSEKIYFDTYADCNRNLILINFRQVR
jgi:hypothetical protein